MSAWRSYLHFVPAPQAPEIEQAGSAYLRALHSGRAVEAVSALQEYAHLYQSLVFTDHLNKEIYPLLDPPEHSGRWNKDTAAHLAWRLERRGLSKSAQALRGLVQSYATGEVDKWVDLASGRVAYPPWDLNRLGTPEKAVKTALKRGWMGTWNDVALALARGGESEAAEDLWERVNGFPWYRATASDLAIQEWVAAVAAGGPIDQALRGSKFLKNGPETVLQSVPPHRTHWTVLERVCLSRRSWQSRYCYFHQLFRSIVKEIELQVRGRPALRHHSFDVDRLYLRCPRRGAEKLPAVAMKEISEIAWGALQGRPWKRALRQGSTRYKGTAAEPTYTASAAILVDAAGDYRRSLALQSDLPSPPPDFEDDALWWNESLLPELHKVQSCRELLESGRVGEALALARGPGQGCSVSDVILASGPHQDWDALAELLAAGAVPQSTRIQVVLLVAKFLLQQQQGQDLLHTLPDPAVFFSVPRPRMTKQVVDALDPHSTQLRDYLVHACGSHHTDYEAALRWLTIKVGWSGDGSYSWALRAVLEKALDFPISAARSAGALTGLFPSQADSILTALRRPPTPIPR